MAFYQRAISTSILQGINSNYEADQPFWSRSLLAFSVFSVPLRRFRPDLFQTLRAGSWKLNEDDYKRSFDLTDSQQLEPIGDLGYSGSTFFTTPNSKYLIKSLPRHFEYHFFQHELLDGYNEFMKNNPKSLLVRITDVLHSATPCLGGLFGIVPTHHIVMENLLHAEQESEKKWETYDLKPTTYFFPERDLFEGKLTSESTKQKLIDEFNDKVRLSRKDSIDLLSQLEEDTRFLEKNNTVDYSLFLVRKPAEKNNNNDSKSAPRQDRSSWREGVPSTDGKWIYRTILLDFFWSKHHLQPKATTGLVNVFNLFSSHGAMSITTTPTEYRTRFLDMVNDLAEVEDC